MGAVKAVEQIKVAVDVKRLKKQAEGVGDRIPTMKKKAKSLTAQQRKFCQLWVISFNLADAWLGAGYKTKTRETAQAAACRFMLSNVKADRYITQLLKKQKSRAEKSADDVVREMEALAFSNIQDFVDTDDEGEFIFQNWEGMGRQKLASIESVKVTTNTTRDVKAKKEYTTKNIQFKLYSKLSALENLGRRFNAFPTKIDHAHSGQVQLLPPIVTNGKDNSPACS